MRRLEYFVTEETEGRTVKSLALGEMRLSRGQFSSLKFSGGLTVDGRPVHADQRLARGQCLTVTFAEDAGTPLQPYSIPLKILYSDADYLIIEKPAPLPTLCSARQDGPTLENALYAALGCPADYVFRPVNRLDKGTSGLMAAARSAHAQQLLQRQLHTGLFVREYLAVCCGVPREAQGVIDLPIGSVGPGVRRAVVTDGQRAVTHYAVERRSGAYSLVRLRLDTGRTHQIRVHLAALGCPVAGDYLYGRPDPRLPGRFALHACLVRFRHPLSGEEVACVSPLPPSLSVFLTEQG